MKLKALGFILILISSVFTANSQTKSARTVEEKMQRLRQLEGQIDELESRANFRPPHWDVKVTGTDAASLTLTIKAWENVSRGTRPLLNIRLREADVPDEYVNQKLAQAALNPSNCGSLPPVKYSHGIGRIYTIDEDYVYNSPTYRMTALKAFPYDRASIPRVLTVLITNEELGSVAPLLHDLLYRYQGVLPSNQISPYRRFSRKDADDLFHRVMGQCGVTGWRREAAYKAVRVGGVGPWKKGQPHRN